MSIFSAINDFVKQHHLLSPETTIIVGLSGGPDSVFLLHYLHKHQHAFNIKLIAAHLDHEWRSNSAQDVQFCEQLCAKLKVPFVAMKMSTLNFSTKYNGSQEELGRKARRYFFELLRKQYCAHAIALAHHADDQQETFFIRLLRGASLTGLCSMRAVHDHYIRPLLTTRKSDIVSWLDANAISYLQDPTNNSDNFLRNRIRHHVIPALQQCDERFATNFARTIEQLQKTENYLDEQTQLLIGQLQNGDKNRLQRTAFLALPEIIQQRILLAWLCSVGVQHSPSQKLWHELVRFIKKPGTGSHAIHTHWIMKKADTYISLHHTEAKTTAQKPA